MALTDPSRRLEAIPPYMFAELERKIAEKRAAGIDVISLGIGDPDEPTYPHIVKSMQEAPTATRSTLRIAAGPSSASRSPTSTPTASASRSTPIPR
jgi:aspartate/methionine/tyrosine aminotransferase